MRHERNRNLAQAEFRLALAATDRQEGPGGPHDVAHRDIARVGFTDAESITATNESFQKPLTVFDMFVAQNLNKNITK